MGRRRHPCGTRGAYCRGCRCEPCRAANGAYQAAWLAAQAFEPDWRSKYPSRPEARRANILDGSTCKVCERKFAHGTTVPADRVCRDCRKDMTVQGPEPPPDPSLF